MVKLIKITGTVFLLLAVVLLVSVRLIGYEPRNLQPGFWVNGDLVAEPVSDWLFTDAVEEIYVQTKTRYLIPHSVTTYCAVYNGTLYLFSAYYSGGTFPDERSWNINVMRDPQVRLKIGEQLFDQSLRYIDDAALREPVHQAFIDKYPQWDSPGLDNVHIFAVGPVT